MNFDEYCARVAKVVHMHRQQAETSNVMEEGEEAERNSVIKECEKAIAEIKNALTNNKGLLDIFDENGKTVTPKKMKKKEIRPRDLKRHILAVRQNLFHHKKTSAKPSENLKKYPDTDKIIALILEDLTAVLGVKDIGKVFSSDDEEAYVKEFGHPKKKEPKPSPKSPVEEAVDIYKAPPGIEPGTPENDEDMEKVMAQLRKDGKIL